MLKHDINSCTFHNTASLISALLHLIWWIICSSLLSFYKYISIYLFNFSYSVHIWKLSRNFTLTSIFLSFIFSKVLIVNFSKMNTKNHLVLINRTIVYLWFIPKFHNSQENQTMYVSVNCTQWSLYFHFP